MLKELTLLMIALWGSQGMPTPGSLEQKQALNELYCDAELLLEKYQSVNKKHLSSVMKSKMEAEFSKSNCNFTKLADECQIPQDFKALFGWLKGIHQEDKLLKPVMDSFSLLIEHQNIYVNDTCDPVASNKIPEFNCPKYSEEYEGPLRENMFHYIFEQYKTLTYELLRSKLKLENLSEVCKAKGY